MTTNENFKVDLQCNAQLNGLLVSETFHFFCSQKPVTSSQYKSLQTYNSRGLLTTGGSVLTSRSLISNEPCPSKCPPEKPKCRHLRSQIAVFVTLNYIFIALVGILDVISITTS